MIHRLKELLFQNKSPKQTIAKNVFWLSISQLGSRLIRAAIIIYAARVLGAAEYGVFSYALGLAGFFTVFADIGVSQIMTRESAKNPDQRSYYFSTTFWIKSILLVLTTLIIIFIVPYFSKVGAAEMLLPFVALLVIFDGLREFSLSFFRALEKMEWEAIVTVITNLIIASSGFLVLYFFATTRVFIVTYAASVGLGALVAIFILHKEFYKIFSHLKKNLIKPIIKSAIPIAFSSTLGAFMLNTDLVMLGWWQSAEKIGYYSAGQKIVQLLFTIPAIVASALFPTLARLIGQQDNQRVKSLMEKTMALNFLMAIPMVIGGIILARPIIELIYGPEYFLAVTNFQVLMITMLLTFPSVLIVSAIFAYDRQNQMTKYLLLAAVSNAVFNAIFIPVYGFIGSSFSTIIALIINIGLGWLLLKRINNFSTLRHLHKIIIASLIMGTLSFIFNKFDLNVIINIIVSAGIYFGILYLLKEEVLDEIRTVLKIVKS